MQISDLVNQYNNSLNAGSKIASGTKGVEQLVKTVSSMEQGQIFEGTINSIKGNKITLGLSTGQSINARVDKGISLVPGQSVFFQVKSNEGGVIQIKPVSLDYGSNLTLLNALEAAGLPKNEKNLNMVNNMMQQQMPIDAKSVANMSHVLSANPNADVSTVVTMNKLDLPINPQMITQFENYKASEGAILNTLKDLSNEIPQTLASSNISSSEVAAFSKELVSIITEGMPIVEGVEVSEATNAKGAVIQAPVNEIETANGNVAPNPATGEATTQGRTPAQTINTIMQNPIVYEKSEFPAGTIGRALSYEDNAKLSIILANHPQVEEGNPKLFDSNGNLNPNASSVELAKAITDYMAANPNMPKEEMMKLLDNSPFKSLVENLMSNKWTLEPKDIVEKGKIDKLYEKIDEDMQKVMESANKTTKSTTNPITQSASGIRDNLQFIAQVNQMYTYVQLPLRMAGQNTTGDLYVYSNKKHKKGEDDELSAFLHFDLDNLGSTDIAVKMKNKNVDTQFFMEDDISFQLIQAHIGELEEKLNSLGYTCKIEVKNDSKSVNLVEDFMKTDVKSAGQIQRYSFDIRA